APLHRSTVRVKLRDGYYRASLLIGVDDSMLIGAPRKMLLGDARALRGPDAVILDKAGYEYLWPKEPLAIGRIVEINDHRAVSVGICETSPPFITLPVVYSSMSGASRILPPETQRTSLVVARAAASERPKDVALRIAAATGLEAMTDREFGAAT